MRKSLNLTSPSMLCISIGYCLFIMLCVNSSQSRDAAILVITKDTLIQYQIYILGLQARFNLITFFYMFNPLNFSKPSIQQFDICPADPTKIYKSLQGVNNSHRWNFPTWIKHFPLNFSKMTRVLLCKYWPSIKTVGTK